MFEAARSVEDGAGELDMVISIGALKSGDYSTVEQDIETVVHVKRSSNHAIVKVIIETSLLTNEEKVAACKLAKEAEVDFVKTRTDFFGGEVTEDVKLMRRIVGKDMGVEVTGGIGSCADAMAMIEAGADRIGTSSTVKTLRTASI